MIEYIRQHKGDIHTHHQDPICWWKKKNNTLHASVQYALDNKALTGIELDSNTHYPKPIRREDVIKYYKQDIYRGFIATMLWGRTRWLKSIVDIPKDTIELKLVDVKNKLIKGDIRDAFISMYSGINKIKGVNWAFFTKILYFMSKAYMPQCTLIPIILDRHMKYVHCALLLDEFQNIHYKWHVSKRGVEDVVWIHNDAESVANVYMDYITRMYNVAQKINTNMDKLEAFLFDKYPGDSTSPIFQEVKNKLNAGKSTGALKKSNANVETLTRKRIANRANNEWTAYEPFYTFNGGTEDMEFIKPGYCLPLRNKGGEIEHYRIFVAKHTGKKYEGLYFCELMRGWRDNGIIDENPDACKILNEFPRQTSKLHNKVITISNQRWYNCQNGKADTRMRMYWYITFNNTVSKEDVITLMKEIIDFVQNTLKN